MAPLCAGAITVRAISTRPISTRVVITSAGALRALRCAGGIKALTGGAGRAMMALTFAVLMPRGITILALGPSAFAVVIATVALVTRSTRTAILCRAIAPFGTTLVRTVRAVRGAAVAFALVRAAFATLTRARRCGLEGVLLSAILALMVRRGALVAGRALIGRALATGLARATVTAVAAASVAVAAGVATVACTAIMSTVCAGFRLAVGVRAAL